MLKAARIEHGKAKHRVSTSILIEIMVGAMMNMVLESSVSFEVISSVCNVEVVM